MATVEKLGPGSDADTLQVLAMLPRDSFQVVIDVGSGIGRQTMALASRLETVVHAIDSNRKYLDRLVQYSKDFGIEHLVQAHCMDMADIPEAFPEIDLLWSECAAYNIGFPNALRSWFPAIKPGGYAVVSELSWLHDKVPAEVRQYFASSYPDMRSLDENVSIARDAGYQILATHVLSKAAWTDSYYDKLKPLAQSLLHHSEKAVRNFANETLKGIRIFEDSENSYGYVFYVLEKP